MKSNQQPLTSKNIFETFLATQGSTHQEQSCVEKDFGRPLDQYEVHYREVKHLNTGGMGSVVLVKRRADGQKFAAKKQ